MGVSSWDLVKIRAIKTRLPTTVLPSRGARALAALLMPWEWNRHCRMISCSHSLPGGNPAVRPSVSIPPTELFPVSLISLLLMSVRRQATQWFSDQRGERKWARPAVSTACNFVIHSEIKFLFCFLSLDMYFASGTESPFSSTQFQNIHRSMMLWSWHYPKSRE